ncbi:MAG: phosphonate monoester hydrolase [Alphaproteobacteria bacterium TMED89]|nr:phosphonate monoester hydrolase [Rhodospirillaceae bacterium]RPH11770.1 MAG: phosphonate monoester hydrolase [Alphaproteobacteria bacterium TMED89]
MNVLWIMADQLRWDYLSCAGHPHLHTPNIDALADKGLRFTNAYGQSPLCGPSRMSAYTGRYVRSHGATYNRVPLRVGERTLGDLLREQGVDPVLVGKTCMVADIEGMARVGIDPGSTIGVGLSECGFRPFERDDGLHPSDGNRPQLNYNDYLRDLGYSSDNPWQDFANSAKVGGDDGRWDDGELRSGWLLAYADQPANIAEEHSETPYMIRRAQEFMATADPDQPWLCHLSLIKPHWPYIVPAPYHGMYGANDLLPVNRDLAEREAGAHPVYEAFTKTHMSRTFWSDEVRARVLPAYMGLIKQIDDHLGRLFAWMEAQGRMQDTMIVFSADHGDYLGDHWMADKELFHDCSTKMPLIIYDPRRAADTTRGTTDDRLVECIDLAPTFQAFFGGEPLDHHFEGRSLLPLLEGRPEFAWRQYAVSEMDYGMREVAHDMGVDVDQARLTMIRDARWKYVHALGFRPMLFDLQADPDERMDLGGQTSATITAVLARFSQAHQAWAASYTRTTYTRDQTLRRGDSESEHVLIGYWDEADFEAVHGKPFEHPDGRDSG